ncbi:MAG: efflux RND transporter periplasmic adaptor subunit [Cellvibrionaceae bacterium]|nr:efflux RND transporter periplasmic adaptor subunit [Cellvibrionaceae bacterium]
MTKQPLPRSLILCLCSTLIACQSESNTPAETASIPRPVKTFTVTEHNDEKSFSLPAVIEAVDQSELSFQVDGMLTKLELTKGAAVKKGDVLAKLDQREFRNALVRAKADFELAKANFERAQTLGGQNAIAEATIDERKAAFDNSRARLNSAQKNLEDSVLRAPYDAVVADFHVESFKTIRSNTPIVTLQTAGMNYAVVQVPASLVIFSEQITITASNIHLDAAPSIEIPALIGDYASLADPVTQTYEARFSFPNQEGLNILPGMTGTLKARYTMKTPQTSSGFEIPLAAVVADSDKTFIWVIEQDNTVTRRYVEIALSSEGNPKVTSGLADGETIVAAGATYLIEGASIRRYER